MGKSVNARTPYEYNRLYGRSVVSSDGVKIGTVDQFVFSSFKEAPYMLVRTGPLGSVTGTDALYVPEAYIKSVDGQVVLAPTKDDIRHHHSWARAPQGVHRW